MPDQIHRRGKGVLRVTPCHGEGIDLRAGARRTALKGVLQRARASLEHHRYTSGRTATPRPAARQERGLAQRFAAAFTRDDIDAVIRLLTDDAWLTMPPAPHEYHGHDAIAAFLHISADWRAGRRVRLVPTRANTQPAYTCYLADPPGPTAHPTGLLVLTLSDQRISAITHFLDEDLTRHFETVDTHRH